MLYEVITSGDDAAVEHAEIDGVREGGVVHVDALKRFVQRLDLVGEIVPFGLGGGFPFAEHPDVRMRNNFV